MREVLAEPEANKCNEKKSGTKKERIRRPPHTNTCSPTQNIFNAHRQSKTQKF